MKVLFILNDPPYGTERVYDALRLSNTLLKKSQTEMTVFLMADSVVAAKAGQKTPDGYYNVERTLEPAGHSIAKSSCAEPAWMRAGSMTPLSLRAPSEHDDELAVATIEPDKVAVF